MNSRYYDCKFFSERKQTRLGFALVLTLAISAIIACLPIAEAAKTTVSASPEFYPYIGMNSGTLINWQFTPNPLNSAPYAGQTTTWSDANITFTRPDGTTDVLKGPFKVTTQAFQGLDANLILTYTPNMKGVWAVQLNWPGDDTYAPISKKDTFNVGDTIPKRDVWAVLSVRPFPAIGLGQSLLINAWVTPLPPTVRGYYSDYMFTFTKPDGTSFKVGPMSSEAPGTVWFDYPMNQLGNWTIKFDYPGDFFNKPASTTETIIVQKDPIPFYQDTPLPTNEWTFPINVENREWRNIAGPWMMNSYDSSKDSWNPYTEAPRTAHVLWELSPVSGIGGFIGSPHSIETGGGEEIYGAGDAGIYSPSAASIRTIMAGRGYYASGGNIYCIDMKTGENLWKVAGSFNVGAIRSRAPALYQFGSRFIVYDGITGAMTLNVTGMAMMAELFEDPYVYSYSGGRIIKWTTEGTSTNFATRIIWNETSPYEAEPSASHSVIQSGLIIRRKTAGGAILAALCAVNTTDGKMVYNQTWGETQSNPSSWLYNQGPAVGSGFGLFYEAGITQETNGRGYLAFNATTGQRVWISEASDYPWGGFWAYRPQASGYNMIYGLSYAGVYAYNVTNGKIVWRYTAGNSGMETPYNSWPFGSTGPVIGGGIVFAPNTEHSPTFYYRGQQLHALDAFTGKKVWSILGIYNPTAIAYGVLVATDTPTGITYGFGKGTTETTIAASAKVVAKGSPILIEGTVTDQSQGQQGTPAISDASMTSWMEYIHMQQPKPTNATGVSVHLTALDPNGNTQEIGRVTSDEDGLYRKGWTPSIEGEYTVIATFEGSDSYYSSHAKTALLVGPAAASAVVVPTPIQTVIPTATAPSPTPSSSPSPNIIPPTSGTNAATYFALSAAVIIIAVAAAAIIAKKRRNKQ